MSIERKSRSSGGKDLANPSRASLSSGAISRRVNRRSLMLVVHGYFRAVAGSVVMPCLLGLVSANLSSHAARGRQVHPRCNIPDFALPADAQLSSPSRTSLPVERSVLSNTHQTLRSGRRGGRGQHLT